MKVVVLSKWFPTPYQPSSGVFVLEQMKALRRLGVEIPLVITPTPWAPRWLRFLARVRKYQGIPFQTELAGFKVEYPRVANLPGDRLFFLYGLLFYLRCRFTLRKLLKREKIDLIHAHTIMPEGFAAVLLGREFRVPVVCTLHGGDINDLLPPIAAPGKKRLAIAGARWALRRIKHLIAVSQALTSNVARLNCNQEVNIKVAQNGADTAVFRPMDKIEARTRLGLPLAEQLVIFIGSLVSDKGVPFLLTAFADIRRPNTMLYLVGDGRKQEDLRAQARKLGIGESCIFAGRRAHAEVPLWLAAADCFVLSSVTEGSPTIISEAMLCRAPIVATAVGGVPELIRNGETGLIVPSKDPDSLGRAMEFILSNPEAAAEMSRLAEIHARKNLTWDANARKTVETYRAALAHLGTCDVPVDLEYLQA